MRHWQKLSRWLGLISLLPAAVIVYVSSHPWLALVMMVSIALLVYIYIKNEKVRVENQYNKQIKAIEQSQIAMLSHLRHDAMNDIQVLLGYIRLDNKDKCIDYVDKIKARSQYESLLARLDDYTLISFMHHLIQINYPVKLDIEYLTESVNWKKEFTRFMIAVITCYRKYTVNHEPCEPQLTVYLGVGDHIHMQFEFNGDLLNDNAWMAEIKLEAAELVRAQRLILTIDEQDINSTFLA